MISSAVYTKKKFLRSVISSGLERTEAYNMRGCNHLRLSKMRSRSTKWGFDIRSISFWVYYKHKKVV